MSILSDREIKQLCTPPNFVVTQRVAAAPPASGMSSIVFRMPTKKDCFSHLTAQELDLQKKSHDSSECGLVSYRPLTNEEKDQFQPMILPFMPNQVRERKVREIVHELDDEIERFERIVSFGLSSFGYDVSIADEFKIFTNVNTAIVNPKNFDEKSFVEFSGDVCIIPPNSFVLARSREYVRMPADVTGVVLSKSTYARCGIYCLTTVLQAGWEGHITLEFANTTPLPAMLFANEGAAQVLFFKGTVPAEVTYADKNGKYMSQTGITLPRL